VVQVNQHSETDSISIIRVLISDTWWWSWCQFPKFWFTWNTWYSCQLNTILPNL